jgi:hypothetical protein
MSDAFFHMPLRGKPSKAEPDAKGGEHSGAGEMGEGERGDNVVAALYMWCIIRDSMQWGQIPKNVRDFNDNFLIEREHKRNGELFFLFGAVCWSLWLNRNDWVFRNRLVSSLRSVIYKLFFFMLRWTIMSTGEDRVNLEKLIEAIRASVRGSLKMAGVG